MCTAAATLFERRRCNLICAGHRDFVAPFEWRPAQSEARCCRCVRLCAVSEFLCRRASERPPNALDAARFRRATRAAGAAASSGVSLEGGLCMSVRASAGAGERRACLSARLFAAGRPLLAHPAERRAQCSRPKEPPLAAKSVRPEQTQHNRTFRWPLSFARFARFAARPAGGRLLVPPPPPPLQPLAHSQHRLCSLAAAAAVVCRPLKPLPSSLSLSLALLAIPVRV